MVATVVGYHLLRLLLTRQGGDWGDVATHWWWWAGIARFGVDVFFVLAGLFVVASWRVCRERATGLGAAVRTFAGRRARRILPPFWVTVVAFGVPALLTSTIDWRQFGLLATTQQYLDHRIPELVNLPSWSLTTEVQFYVLVPVIAVAVRWGRGWPLLALTCATSLWWIDWAGQGDLGASLLPGRLDQFVAGALVGELVARVELDERPWAVRAATARGAGVALLLALLALGTWHGATFQQPAGGGGFFEDATHPIAGVLIAALVLRWRVGTAPRFLLLRPWRALGLVSFGLYLWHYPVLELGLGWLGITGADADPSGPAILLASALLVAIAVGLATASYLVVERRLGRSDRPDRAELPAPAPTSGAAVPAGGGEELGGRLPGGAGVGRARQHA